MKHQQQPQRATQVEQRAQVHTVPCSDLERELVEEFFVLEREDYVLELSGVDLTLSSANTLKLTDKPRGRPTIRHRKVSDETKEEIQDEDEATLRDLLMRYVIGSPRPARSLSVWLLPDRLALSLARTLAHAYFLTLLYLWPSIIVKPGSFDY